MDGSGRGQLRRTIITCVVAIAGWELLRRGAAVLQRRRRALEGPEPIPEEPPKEAAQETKPGAAKAAPTAAPAAVLQLERPLIAFDLEATGLSIAQERIIEICAIKLFSDGRRVIRTQRINPGRPISPGAAAVLTLTDADLVGEPTFQDVAVEWFEFLQGCDLTGFNAAKFDVPMLRAEFARCGLVFPKPGVVCVDSMTIFHKRERRNLGHAFRFYTGQDLEDAHTAEADTRAALEVLLAQVQRYGLPRRVTELGAEVTDSPNGRGVDGEGKLVWRDGHPCFTFGKHEGSRLMKVVHEDPSYCRWIIKKSRCSEEVKAIVADALEGRYPVPPP